MRAATVHRQTRSTICRVSGATRLGAKLSFNPAPSTSTNGYSSATWNFGDGSHTAFFAGPAAMTRANHRYKRAGHYLATLTLVDTRGNVESTTRRVRIHAR